VTEAEIKFKSKLVIELMGKGLIIEIKEKPGAGVIIYKIVK
jgi:hypothetical protein